MLVSSSCLLLLLSGAGLCSHFSDRARPKVTGRMPRPSAQEQLRQSSTAPSSAASNVTSNPDFLVVIVGAGATGLLVAQGLKQAKIPFRIFERHDPNSSSRRPRDWSMGLHWGREYIEKLLPQNLKDDMHTISTDHWSESLPRDQYEWAQSQFDLTTFPMVHGVSGQVITHVKAATSRRASRQKTKDLFSRGLDIEYGKSLVWLDDDGEYVTCQFDDGSTVKANAVIGCDSVKSKVRSFVMSPEADRLETLPTVMYNFTQKYTAEQARFIREKYHPNFKYAIHPEMHVAFILTILDVPDINDPENWTFQLMLDQWGHSNHRPTSAERLAHCRQISERLCEPFRSALQWVKEDTFIPADRPQHMPNLQRWNNHQGRITLAGDAAHPMAPYRAQGLNNAMHDAVNYVEAIKSAVQGGQSLSDLISGYDRELVERGRKEIELSAYQGLCTHNWEKLIDSPLVKNGMHRMDEKMVPLQTAPCQS